MKKVFFTILGMLIFCVLFAQEIPQKISYQGKLLEDETPVTGTKSITFTIDTWTELHPNVPVTKGLYSVTLGKTTPIPTHIFDNSTSVTLQISVEGTNLEPETDILSVPYAYKTEKSVNAENAEAIGGNAVSTTSPSTNQVLKWNDSSWSPSNDNINDADADPTNEIQTLSQSGTNVTLSNGGGTVSVADNDNSSTNEFQTLSINVNDLTITPNGNTVTLPSGSSLWSQSGNDIYYNSGKVGIGTSNPYGIFEVYNTSAVDEYVTAGSITGVARTWYSVGSVGFGNSWNVGIRGDLNKGYAIESYSGGWAPRLFITQAGNVGIGTITPDPAIRLSAYTSVSGNAAIGGYAYGSSGTGVFGYSDGGFAGVQGNGSSASYGVYYQGGLGGSGSKSCVIRTSKGPTEMYCVESPENWFEDFGSSKLINGHTHIDLDSYFIETVTINGNQTMKVFIQLKDNCNGVYVKTGVTGFDVYELNNGTSNAEFDYRIIAKRKGYETQRMKVVENCYLDRFLYPDDNDTAIPPVWKEKRNHIKR